MNIRPVKTTTFGSNPVTLCMIKHWNNLQNKLNSQSALPDLSGNTFLKTIKKIIAN